MSTSETLLNLKIHKMSNETYNAKVTEGSIDSTALYLTPEEEQKNLVIKLNGGTEEGVSQFTYNGENEKIVNIATTYTNDTPIVIPVGSIVEGQTFKDVTVQDMLTMILYKYVDITVSLKSSSSSTGAYYVHNLPTLTTVTFNVKKNSATNITFALWDKTGNSKIATLTDSDITNDQLTFSNLNVDIRVTRTFELRYSYTGEGNASVSKTCAIGTFTISFLAPSTPTISSSLGTSTSYSSGQTATLSTITASVANLNSAAATGNITKLELYKDGTQVGNTVTNPTLPYIFSVNQSLTSATTSTIKYKVRAYYNTRTGSSTSLSETSIDSSDLSITFNYVNPTVYLTGLTSRTVSKFSPITITSAQLGARFRKHSGKIDAIKLLEGNTVKETKSITGYSDIAYSDTEGTTAFGNYSKSNICTTTSWKAKAYYNDAEVAASSTYTLTFYAPYCWGFVDASTTIDSINKDILSGLSNKQQSAPTNGTIDLSAPDAQKKVVFAAPNGSYTKITDLNTGMPATGAFTKKNITITFADNSTQTYQVFILTIAAKAAAKLKFE